MASQQRCSELGFFSRPSSSRSPAGVARQGTPLRTPETETTESPVTLQTPSGARPGVRAPGTGAERSLENLSAKMGELQKSNERIELALKELQGTSHATQKGRKKLPKELSVSKIPLKLS